MSVRVYCARRDTPLDAAFAGADEATSPRLSAFHCPAHGPLCAMARWTGANNPTHSNATPHSFMTVAIVRSFIRSFPRRDHHLAAGATAPPQPQPLRLGNARRTWRARSRVDEPLFGPRLGPRRELVRPPTSAARNNRLGGPVAGCRPIPLHLRLSFADGHWHGCTEGVAIEHVPGDGRFCGNGSRAVRRHR